MSITIEGFSVVAKRELVQPFLDDNRIVPPNRMFLSDDDIWRCSFMSNDDAGAFVKKLETIGLNGSTGPNPDVVLVNEFNHEVYPYCEWLELGNFQKAIDELKSDLARMASLVETNFNIAIKGLIERDSNACAQVIADDEEIDQLMRSGRGIMACDLLKRENGDLPRNNENG